MPIFHMSSQKQKQARGAGVGSLYDRIYPRWHNGQGISEATEPACSLSTNKTSRLRRLELIEAANQA